MWLQDRVKWNETWKHEASFHFAQSTFCRETKVIVDASYEKKRGRKNRKRKNHLVRGYRVTRNNEIGKIFSMGVQIGFAGH